MRYYWLKVEDWNWETIFYKCYFYLQPLWHYRSAKLSNSVKRHKIRAITTFKVIQGIEVGTNRKPVCDFLLVINSNWHPLESFRSYRSLLFKFWTLCVFCLFGGLMDNVRCSSLLVLIELFSLGVTAEALRAMIGSKSAISLQRGQPQIRLGSLQRSPDPL